MILNDDLVYAYKILNIEIIVHNLSQHVQIIRFPFLTNIIKKIKIFYA